MAHEREVLRAELSALQAEIDSLERRLLESRQRESTRGSLPPAAASRTASSDTSSTISPMTTETTRAEVDTRSAPRPNPEMRAPGAHAPRRSMPADRMTAPPVTSDSTTPPTSAVRPAEPTRRERTDRLFREPGSSPIPPERRTLPSASRAPSESSETRTTRPSHGSADQLREPVRVAHSGRAGSTFREPGSPRGTASARGDHTRAPERAGAGASPMFREPSASSRSPGADARTRVSPRAPVHYGQIPVSRAPEVQSARTGEQRPPAYGSRGEHLDNIISSYKEKFEQKPFYQEPLQSDGSCRFTFGEQKDAIDFFKEQSERGESFLCREETGGIDAHHLYSFGKGRFYQGTVAEITATMESQINNASNREEREALRVGLEQFQNQVNPAVRYRQEAVAARHQEAMRSSEQVDESTPRDWPRY